ALTSVSRGLIRGGLIRGGLIRGRPILLGPILRNRVLGGGLGGGRRGDGRFGRRGRVGATRAAEPPLLGPRGVFVLDQGTTRLVLGRWRHPSRPPARPAAARTTIRPASLRQPRSRLAGTPRLRDTDLLVPPPVAPAHAQPP